MTKPARVTLVLFLAALILVPYRVSADDASSPKPLTSVVAIFTRSDDLDDKKAPDDLDKAFAARLPEMAKAGVLDLPSALSPAARSALKGDSMKRLLAFPELIPRSDRVRRNIQADGLLITRIDLFGKSGKSYYVSADLTFYDFRNGACEELDIGSVDFRGGAERKDFLQAAAGRIIEELQRAVPGMQASATPAPKDDNVVCNTQSRLFHSPSCHHLPAKSVPVEIMSHAEAREAGYKPCLICYPETRKRIKPDSTEAMLGAEVAGFVEYYYRVSSDPEQHARLEKVGRRVLADNHFTKRNYVFTALNSDEINAFAAPAGYIYVTTGMLDTIESDDELAAVLSHEIAHVEQEHGLRQYRRAQKAATLGILVSILSGQNLSILADFVRELVLRGYDRRYESEADRGGYIYARRTSYDPEAMSTLLGKLQDMELANSPKIASWMRTHPKAEERIRSVDEYKSESEAASEYIAELDKVDAGLASAVRADELRYVESVDQLKACVEAIKLLP
ncbi:MAG TPA: M48 family metallopeptidase [Armatimonadota bacterium]|nr:M48 family metallopeptidase [Armatimonadota bacterium]